ncbi:hypothetical protein [Dolosicoccus paucivorans]|uniref:hypothetical protein n=1 Tax=Dolosicoccus paucivorans TaxID=84521 RepID=UPI00087F429D|nr:hypothetical protein [Dolosicoccus paucivorans]SDI87616.1 hypothetical protein SAMN04487994_10643 [Dolosicoccus paucivorans]
MKGPLSKDETIRRAERQYDIEEGRKLERQRMVISMYQLDFPSTQIVSIVGLSLEEVNEIIKITLSFISFPSKYNKYLGFYAKVL